jgi:glutaminyl-peptide cyclotransferase
MKACAMRGARRGRPGLTAAGLVLVVVLSGCGAPRFDGEAAFRYLERQCEFGPRPPGSLAHDETLAWLIDELGRFADHVAVQRFEAVMDTGTVEFGNVIASFCPTERSRVLLAAHWDTRAVADRDPDPANRETPIPGANDGASGVAVLLELARMMSERAPRVGVDLVLFDGEDGGDGGGLADWCLGSSYYASMMGDYCPSYAIVIDMIGDRDLSIPREPNSVSASGPYVDRVWGVAKRVEANAFVDERGVAMYDDHVPLIRAGVPAVLVIDPSYVYWHTVEDTPDKCSAESLEQVGRVLTSLIYERG